jgi:hypothetical protein
MAAVVAAAAAGKPQTLAQDRGKIVATSCMQPIRDYRRLTYALAPERRGVARLNKPPALPLAQRLDSPHHPDAHAEQLRGHLRDRDPARLVVRAGR